MANDSQLILISTSPAKRFFNVFLLSGIISSSKYNRFLFSFRHIYPTTGSFEIYEGSKKIFGENSENNYFWVLISVSKKDNVKGFLNQSKKDYLSSLLFSGFIVLIIVVLVFLVAFKNNKNKYFWDRKK